MEQRVEQEQRVGRLRGHAARCRRCSRARRGCRRGSRGRGRPARRRATARPAGAGSSGRSTAPRRDPRPRARLRRPAGQRRDEHLGLEPGRDDERRLAVLGRAARRARRGTRRSRTRAPSCRARTSWTMPLIRTVPTPGTSVSRMTASSSWRYDVLAHADPELERRRVLGPEDQPDRLRDRRRASRSGSAAGSPRRGRRRRLGGVRERPIARSCADRPIELAPGAPAGAAPGRPAGAGAPAPGRRPGSGSAGARGSIPGRPAKRGSSTATRSASSRARPMPERHPDLAADEPGQVVPRLAQVDQALVPGEPVEDLAAEREQRRPLAGRSGAAGAPPARRPGRS